MHLERTKRSRFTLDRQSEMHSTAGYGLLASEQSRQLASRECSATRLMLQRFNALLGHLALLLVLVVRIIHQP